MNNICNSVFIRYVIHIINGSDVCTPQDVIHFIQRTNTSSGVFQFQPSINTASLNWSITTKHLMDWKTTHENKFGLFFFLHASKDEKIKCS